jgi:hypothetical protein
VLGFILAKLASMVVVNQQQGEGGAKGEKGEAGAPGAGVTLLSGAVSAAGAKVSGSAGWTVANLGAGLYKVTFTVPFAAFSTPVATLQNSALETRTAYIKQYTKEFFEVETLHAGARVNDNFNFMCTGG